MRAVEICINATSVRVVAAAAAAALAGGATTIELCADMAADGLTPPPAAIRAARRAFSRAGLMVMIRPRAGDFVYTAAELSLMQRQIELAAACGADGVVFGPLIRRDRLGGDSGGCLIDEAALTMLCLRSRAHELTVTFHRAFDATSSPTVALETLIAQGVHRVLTSGMPWGQPGGALDGRAALGRLAEQAAGRIEIVIGGGVTADNAGRIVRALPHDARVTLHAYSGVLVDGAIAPGAVRALVDTV